MMDGISANCTVRPPYVNLSSNEELRGQGSDTILLLDWLQDGFKANINSYTSKM